MSEPSIEEQAREAIEHTDFLELQRILNEAAAFPDPSEYFADTRAWLVSFGMNEKLAAAMVERLAAMVTTHRPVAH